MNIIPFLFTIPTTHGKFLFSATKLSHPAMLAIQ